MKQFYTLLVALCALCSTSQAQSYKWIKGGGSTSSMTPSRNDERIHHITTDASGNVYVIGVVGDQSITADTFYRPMGYYVGGPPLPHVFIASYNCNGQMRWAKLWGNNGEGTANGIVCDAAGNVYCLGSLSASNVFSKEFGDTTLSGRHNTVYLVKYDTAGNFKWVRTYGQDALATLINAGLDRVLDIDRNGFIHVVSNVATGVQLTSTVTSMRGIYDLRYNSAGTLLDATRLQVDSTQLIKQAVFSKTSDRYYARIMRDASTGPANTGIFCFNPTGTLIWRDTLVSLSNIAQLNGIGYRGGNEIYVGGYAQQNTFTFAGLSLAANSYGTMSTSMGFIFKIDTNGVGKWAFKFDSNQPTSAIGTLAVLPDGKIAATGFASGRIKVGTDSITVPTADGRNALMLVIDSSKNTVKLDHFAGAGFYDAGRSVAANATGNIFIGGEVESAITPTGLTGYSSTGGNTDFFLVKYGFGCCATTPTANYTKTVNNTTKTGTFTYTGTTTSIDSLVWNWGDGTKTKVTTGFTTPVSHTWTVANNYLVSVTVYSQCGTNTSTQPVAFTTGVEDVLSGESTGLALYPNPAQHTVTVGYNFGTDAQSAATRRRIVIYDALGRAVSERSLQDGKAAGQYTVEVDNLAAALYLVRMEEDGKAVETQRLSITH